MAWIVNLYNFMDGMDGFAGGMTVIGFTTLAALCASRGAAELAAMSLAVAASALGFLLFNFPPARIFMGDLGSSLLGYLCAVAMLSAESSASIPLWISALVFSPFIVDASVTLARRTLAGERPWRAHRDHFYQRLVRLGWGHRKTVVCEYGLMLACAVSAAAALPSAAGPPGQYCSARGRPSTPRSCSASCASNGERALEDREARASRRPAAREAPEARKSRRPAA